MKTAYVFIVLLAFGALGYCGGLENWIEESRRPEDVQALLDELERNPLDLNAATVQQLEDLPFFDRQSAEALIGIRQDRNGFHALREVLALSILSDIQRDILRRCAVVPEAAQFKPSVDIQTAGGGQQATDTWWSRQRSDFRTPNRIHAILYLKHGPGHPDLFNQTEAGLEFRPNGAASSFILGDLQCEAGSGLVFATASGQANWLAGGEGTGPGESRGIKLRPSSNRRFLYRGIGLTSSQGPLEVTLVAGITPRNARADSMGIMQLTEGESTGSIPLAEAREDQIEERLAGGAINVSSGFGSLGLAGYRARWSQPIDWSVTDGEPLSALNVGSAFIGGNLAGLSFRSEVAVSDPGGYAHQSVLAFRRAALRLTLYHTFADQNFFSPHSAVWGGFSEEARNMQTTGLRIQASGLKQRIGLQAGISDTPFRTGASSLPTHSSFFEGRWTFRPSQPVQLEFLGARSIHEETGSNVPSRRVTLDHAKIQTVIHSAFDYEIRYEIRSSGDDQSSDHGFGTLVYFQPRIYWQSLEILPRVTFYNFSGNNVSIQPYEPGISGHSPIVSLSGTGHRTSLYVSRQWSGFEVGLQCSQSRYDFNGSGGEAFEAGLQMSYRR